MPRHNNTVAADRLRSWMGAKGPAAIDTISPEIVPVVQVADLSQQDEGARLTRYCMGYHTQAAAASNYPHCGIYNPAASEVEVLVDSLEIGTTVAGNFTLRQYDAQSGWTLGGNRGTVDIPAVDTFTLGVADMSAVLSAVNHTSLYGTIILGFYRVDTKLNVRVPLQVRLLPGKGILVNCTGANVALFTTWTWRESVRVP